MGKLSELIEREYAVELEIIKDAGTNIWLTGIGLTVGIALVWAMDTFLWGEPWSKRAISWAILFIVVCPFVLRAWERHKVAAGMRHEREVRVDIKLDALLGLVNIKDSEDEPLSR